MAKDDKEKEETPETAEKRADETVPGGEYIVDGKKVNASGEEIGGKKKS